MYKKYFYKKQLCVLPRLLFFVFGISFFSHSIAEENPLEYKIKAAYLYNFTKFISWPENESETFNICLVGKDPFGSIINPIEKRTVKSKPIRLFRLETAADTQHCQIVYLSSLTRKPVTLAGILTIASLTPSLTVGELKSFTQSGGMIAFFQKQGKVKLHINLKVLRNSGLDISAKLLEVAEVYEGESND